MNKQTPIQRRQPVAISAPVTIRAYQGTRMVEIFVAGHRYHLSDAYENCIAWMGGDGKRISKATHAQIRTLWGTLFA